MNLPNLATKYLPPNIYQLAIISQCSTKSNTQIYLRFLNLTQAVAGAGADAEVDLLALRLLETIALAHAKGKPLTVTKSMELSAIASPATQHRKMDALARRRQ